MLEGGGSIPHCGMTFLTQLWHCVHCLNDIVFVVKFFFFLLWMNNFLQIIFLLVRFRKKLCCQKISCSKIGVANTSLWQKNLEKTLVGDEDVPSFKKMKTSVINRAHGWPHACLQWHSRGPSSLRSCSAVFGPFQSRFITNNRESFVPMLFLVF
jgi:hypothetical protein